MDNKLDQHPFFSTPVAPQPKLPPIEERLNREIPPEPTGKDIARDVGRSIVSEGAKGVAGTLIGGPGSVESFITKDIPELGRAGAAYLGEKADIISPQQRQEMTAAPLYSDEQVQKGYRSPLFGMPTYKGVTETFKPTMEAITQSPTAPQGAKDVAGALAYEPKTGPGQVAGAAAEMGAQGIPGALRTMPGRVITGAGAGAGSETFRQGAQGQDGEGAAAIAGALTGALGGAYASSLAGKLFAGLRSAVAPGAVGVDQLSAALAQDIRRGQAALTPDQIKELMDRGVNVTVLDMAGPETRKLIGKMATQTPELEERVRLYNESLAKRGAESSQRLSGDMERLFGQPVDAAKLTDLVDAAGKKTRDEVYRNLNAKDIIVDQAPFADLLDRPVMKQAMREAELTRKDFPQYEIKAPTKTAAVEPKPTGVVDEFGNPIMSQGVSETMKPGNLAYWDMVKQKLDDVINTAKPGTTEYNAALNAKRDLLKSLDAIPGYPQARGAAFETFQASSAPEAGYKFFNTTDAFKRSDLQKIFNGLSDSQKELFSVGFASKLDEMIKGGNIDAVARKFADGNFRDRAMIALGKDRFHELNGAILAESLASKVRQVPFVQQAHLAPEAVGALGAGAGAAMEFLLSGGLSLGLKTAGATAAGVAAARTGQAFLNNMERKVAERVIPMALSNDPKQIKRLGEYAARVPAVNQVLNKLTAGVTAIGTVASREYGQRAHGGRIERKAGGRITHHYDAARLVKSAELAKKNLGQQTESILNAPDEHVVKALAVANKSIEG